MKLFFGGAYNGKLQYVKDNFNIKDEEIFFCRKLKDLKNYENNSYKEEIDFSKKVICGIDKFIYSKVLNGEDVVDYFKDNLENLRGKILICDEITSGIVPIKKEERLWREETGKVLQFLSKESEEVYRIFFGICKKLKGED